jgi:hypothetical protein
MAPLEGQDAGPGDYTIIFDAGSIKGVDVVFEDCLSEAEAINSFIAWLRNLNEDGSEPVGWDGWKREFYANIDGAGTRRVVFETRWTSSFQVVKGTRETYGHKYRG